MTNSASVPWATSRNAKSTTAVGAGAVVAGAATGNPAAVARNVAYATEAANVLVASSAAKVVCSVT